MKLSKRSFAPRFLGSVGLLFLSQHLQAIPGGENTTATDYQKLSETYISRMETASESLLNTRNSILDERAPLADSIQTLQDTLIHTQAELQEWKMRLNRLEQERSHLRSSIDSLKKNINYIKLLSEEVHTGTEASLLPGENAQYEETLNAIQLLRQHRNLSKTAELNHTAVELELTRIQSALGGFKHSGIAIENPGNHLIEGTVFHIGPANYFVSADQKTTGLLKKMDGSLMPHLFALPGYGSNEAKQLLAGEESWIPLDVTGGRAMKMEDAKGNVWDHIQKGGIVGYIIIGLGAFGLLTGLLKLWDFRELSVDKPKVFYSKLSSLTSKDIQNRNASFAAFRKSVHQLVEIALKYSSSSRDLVDEMLYAYVLLQRNHHEKRLPLLRVVAASAPLLGLLGTVVGMIKTFTLITVFGTGNAAKLSSGISEALVTTELGLIVAIPTVILFGYLAHQTETRLSLLEQYSTDLSNAIESIKSSTVTGTTEG